MSLYTENQYIYRPSPGKYTVASFLLMLVSCLYALADSRDALLVYAQVGEQSITHVIVHWESVYIYRPSPGKYTVASFLLMLVSCLYALADSRDALLVYAQVGEQSITYVIIYWEPVYRPSSENTGCWIIAHGSVMPVCTGWQSWCLTRLSTSWRTEHYTCHCTLRISIYI